MATNINTIATTIIIRLIKISDNINSDYWNGEDVMGIFFNEFTRYKGKTEQGQVFTPDHITSLMYRICGVSYKDRVLDACCGSGAFLVKAMRNMIKEVGGINNECAVKDIKHNKLFGIEFDKEVYTKMDELLPKGKKVADTASKADRMITGYGDFTNEQIADEAIRYLKIAVENGFAHSGDHIIITAGFPLGKKGRTNMLHTVYIP